jgi:hypothetical protein
MSGDSQREATLFLPEKSREIGGKDLFLHRQKMAL